MMFCSPLKFMGLPERGEGKTFVVFFKIHSLQSKVKKNIGQFCGNKQRPNFSYNNKGLFLTLVMDYCVVSCGSAPWVIFIPEFI